MSGAPKGSEPLICAVCGEPLVGSLFDHIEGPGKHRDIITEQMRQAYEGMQRSPLLALLNKKGQPR